MELEAIALYREGLHKRDSGDLDAALTLLERAEDLAPPRTTIATNALLARIRLLGLQLNRVDEALPLCDRALALHPVPREALLLKGRLAMELRQKILALQAFKRLARLHPQDGTAYYEIAKLLRSDGRSRLALKLARRALALGSRELGLFALLAQLSIVRREPDAGLTYLSEFSKVRTLPPHLAALRDRAIALCRHKDRGQEGDPAPRHIAIGGHSYSGSTVLGALLGSVEGAGHAGETQELIQRPDPSSGSSPMIDFERDSDDVITHCRMCGPRCDVFTRSFRADLSADPFGFYAKVGRRMGVRTLITSDKFVTELVSKDPLFDFDLIILYKPVRSWIRSYARRKLSGDVQRAERQALIRKWLKHWSSSYSTLLNDILPQRGVVALNWEAFVATPHMHFERLLEHLGLPGNPEYIFEHVRPGHYVGGNTTPSVLTVMQSRRIKFKQSDAKALAPEEEDLVSRDDAALETQQRLDRRYQAAFRGI